MKRTKEEAEVTKEKVFKAAQTVFRKRGYSGTRLEDIATEAGVTRGAIYWHFKNKYNLFKSLLYKSFYSHIQRIEAIQKRDTAGPEVKLKNLMKEVLVTLETDNDLQVAYEILFFKIEFAEALAEEYEKIMEYNKILQQLLLKCIKEGIQSGVFKADIDPNLTMFAIFSYLNGIQMSWINAVNFNISGFSLQKKADDLINFMLQPLLA